MVRRLIRPGDNVFVCDRSGQEHYASEGEMEWNGLFVHRSHYEPRQPQDFVKGLLDRQVVSITRPVQDPDFITTPITADDL
jgi:hypothetical protein